jgi:glycosyltransferase involved in cell wall biosynthesis
MAEDGLVSVVIPTKDRPEMLRRAVSSVLGQTYAPIEVIVVDDGSAASELI